MRPQKPPRGWVCGNCITVPQRPGRDREVGESCFTPCAERNRLLFCEQCEAGGDTRETAVNYYTYTLFAIGDVTRQSMKPTPPPMNGKAKPLRPSYVLQILGGSVVVDV